MEPLCSPADWRRRDAGHENESSGDNHITGTNLGSFMSVTNQSELWITFIINIGIAIILGPGPLLDGSNIVLRHIVITAFPQSHAQDEFGI